MSDDSRVTERPATIAPYSGGTAWTRGLTTPLRAFLGTETGSAIVLLGGTLLALAWANAHPASYTAVWDTPLSLRLGSATLSLTLRGWVDNGLMTLFFLVVGLEARREFDMGELRDRRRLALPLAGGLAGLVLPVVIYVALNAGRPSVAGWGAAMSTDTAFALGMLALVGPLFPARLRAFMLTVLVVDDLVSLCVIAIAYSRHVELVALLVAIGVLVLILVARAAGVRLGPVYAVLALALWVALLRSGVDPVVTGLVLGLLTNAYPAARDDLERASVLFRLFREQPTPELARSASQGLGSAISPNDRLQQRLHPWTSYLVVPLFALANAGIVFDRTLLSRALHSPITLGIVIGYVLGKPIGIFGVTTLLSRLSRGRLRAPVGWASVAGGGAIAGIGLTLSLLISTLAFSGEDLAEAKLGALSGALIASVLSWLVFRATALLPMRVRKRALLGTAESIVDLAAPVDPRRDHVRGPADALVTIVEYADFECSYCGQAEPIVREVLAGFGDVRYVWRHLPLNDVHRYAQTAAEAAEAAAVQGAFWDMHDLLLAHQGELRAPDVVRYAESIGIDVERFREDLRTHAGAPRIAEDVDSADLSGVSGTPTFFVNGRRHHGVYDVEALSTAVRAARARAGVRR